MQGSRSLHLFLFWVGGFDFWWRLEYSSFGWQGRALWERVWVGLVYGIRLYHQNNGKRRILYIHS